MMKKKLLWQSALKSKTSMKFCPGNSLRPCEWQSQTASSLLMACNLIDYVIM